jgi:hypothetical protein
MTKENSNVYLIILSSPDENITSLAILQIPAVNHKKQKPHLSTRNGVQVRHNDCYWR